MITVLVSAGNSLLEPLSYLPFFSAQEKLALPGSPGEMDGR